MYSPRPLTSKLGCALRSEGLHVRDPKTIGDVSETQPGLHFRSVDVGTIVGEVLL